jgi:hypothetical protein
MASEELMLNCMVKAATGFPCPGCGSQRAFWLLIEGDIVGSLQMYPALVPAFITVLFTLLHLYFRFARGHRVIVGMTAFSVTLMIVNYIVGLTLTL